MGKLSTNEKKGLFFISLIYLSIALIITHGEYVFGSSTDWAFQHTVFPEYFRQLFYKTGDLFPDFALNLGAGQNIFYFAYYGLFSPIILISYLFPFVSMGVYMVLAMLVLGIVSIYLFYKWFREFNFSFKICMFATMMFALSCPLLFHSHRHIMFVSYMPFLLMGLIGVRKYFYNGQKGFMIISVFLMIITSFYFSVGGIICMTIYGVFEYLKMHDEFIWKDFFKEGLRFALFILIGILMASFLLFPVIYALINGRGESYFAISLAEAIIPNINLEFLIYDSYSVGLSAVSFLAIIYLMFLRKEKKFLGILLSLMILCPIFVYVLNGNLYLDGKALIPFLPLYVLAFGCFLKEVFAGGSAKRILVIILVSVLWAFLSDNSLFLYFTLECLLFLVCLFLYKKWKSDFIILIPFSILFFIICLNVNLGDKLISKDRYNNLNDSKIGNIIEDIKNSDDSFYRIQVDLDDFSLNVNYIYDINQMSISLYSSTYNVLYNEFFYDFNNNRASRNMFVTSERGGLLFESLMGVKYLITDSYVPYGYRVWKDYGDYTVYVNEDAFPLGYATDRIMEDEKIEKLDYPADDLALFGLNIKESDNDLVKEESLDLSLGDKKKLTIKNYKEGYKVLVNDEDGGVLRVKLDSNDEEKFYLLRFTLENPQSCILGDTSISVNGINNKLTCATWKYFNSNYTFDYTLSSDDYLDIKFSKGTHYISKVEFYSLKYSELVDSYFDVDPFEVDEYFGDKISGTIDVTDDGYFVLSIPYDEGFIIKVDGEEREYEKVNESFIGFTINKGTYNIEIEFKAPYALAGKCASGVGILGLAIVLIYDKVRRKNG